MPRPEGKPPTEGGKKLKQELIDYLAKANPKNEEERIDYIVLFFINKVAGLQDQIDEIC